MITIPDTLRSKASRVSGGQQWLAQLPEACLRLSQLWSLDLGPAFAGCHVSLVVTANQHECPLVLKVPMPATVELGTLAAGARLQEAEALGEWAGNGAIQLIEYDTGTGAMLAERCVPGASLADLKEPHDADDLAAELLSRLHVSPPQLRQFQRLADRAVQLAHDLPTRVEAARMRIDQHMLDTATDLFGQLSQPGPTEVLLHGDFHLDNVLAATRQPWLAIDPLPMIGDPAHDPVQYLLFRKGDLANPGSEWGPVIERFSLRLDLDPERVKAWMFARLVSDATAAFAEGATLPELEAPHADLWTARLVDQLRR